MPCAQPGRRTCRSCQRPSTPSWRRNWARVQPLMGARSSGGRWPSYTLSSCRLRVRPRPAPAPPVRLAAEDAPRFRGRPSCHACSGPSTEIRTSGRRPLDRRQCAAPGAVRVLGPRPGTTRPQSKAWMLAAARSRRPRFTWIRARCSTTASSEAASAAAISSSRSPHPTAETVVGTRPRETVVRTRPRRAPCAPDARTRRSLGSRWSRGRWSRPSASLLPGVRTGRFGLAAAADKRGGNLGQAIRNDGE